MAPHETAKAAAHRAQAEAHRLYAEAALLDPSTATSSELRESEVRLYRDLAQTYDMMADCLETRR